MDRACACGGALSASHALFFSDVAAKCAHGAEVGVWGARACLAGGESRCMRRERCKPGARSALMACLLALGCPRPPARPRGASARPKRAHAAPRLSLCTLSKIGSKISSGLTA